MNSLVSASVRIAARMRSGREVSSDLARAVALSIGLAAAVAGSADRSLATEPDPSIEEILIRGQDTDVADLFVVTPDRATPNAPDTTEMMNLVPGGDVVNNGPLSGQVQYRGMFGSRVGVRIDGMYISPGGPNWMDAPLHYAPRILLENLAVPRGIASVSAGAESIGGSAHAKLKRSQFTDSESFSAAADAQVSGRNVDSSIAGGGILSLANERHRFQLVGSAEVGDDMRAAKGRIVPTEFERYTYGGGYGVRLTEQHEVGIGYRHNDTGRSGNPALPMDIKYVNTEIANIEYSGHWSGAEIALNAYFMDVDHVMDNFGLRTPPASAALFRSTHATSTAFGYEAKTSLPFYDGTLAVGTDGHLVDHDMDVSNPNSSAFFVSNFNHVDRDRYSLFGEWRRNFGERWKLELGVRYSLIHMDAGNVDIGGIPASMLPPAQQLRDAFNAANREKFEHLVDAVVKLAVEPWSGWLVELSGGRKTRAPSYVERYAWLPLQATGGLADGNNYVGDIGLDPEESYLVDLGVEWRRADFYVAPRAFYHWVDDYIQGVPSTNADVIALSGPTTALVFANVEAELFGLDVPYAVRLPLNLQLDGTLSWVRAKRRDIDDNLYRIAPLRGRTTLSYLGNGWQVAVEGVYAARQSHVSASNGESPTGGWGVMNVFASWEVSEGIELEVGGDNVLDADYAHHLAGISRIDSSGVSMGERLPGPGWSVYGRLTARFR
ncbi:MAG: TonB-dependent receptor [Deltaproteobacteria bacterium]|nr:TonB-dependent receptor [Deltaproteobacteria bacterium]